MESAAAPVRLGWCGEGRRFGAMCSTRVELPLVLAGSDSRVVPGVREAHADAARGVDSQVALHSLLLPQCCHHSPASFPGAPRASRALPCWCWAAPGCTGLLWAPQCTRRWCRLGALKRPIKPRSTYSGRGFIFAVVGRTESERVHCRPGITVN